MIEELALLLAQWREHTPFPCDDDWVFASPHQDGEWPYNPVSAMRYWVRQQPREQDARSKLDGTPTATA
jgi:hypothetical protein